MTIHTDFVSIAAKLAALRTAALDPWMPKGSAPSAAKARATSAWDGAVLAAGQGLLPSARAYLKVALEVAQAEGAGYEEERAIQIVDAAAKIATVTAEAAAFERAGLTDAAATLVKVAVSSTETLTALLAEAA